MTSEGTDYRWSPVGAESLEEAVRLAVGSASMCWENMGGTGVFQSEQALGIADGLVKWIGEQVAPPLTLAQDITVVLNRHSAENASDTPDFILSGYLMACLAAFNAATDARGDYYGHHCSVGQCSHVVPEGGTRKEWLSDREYRIVGEQ